MAEGLSTWSSIFDKFFNSNCLGRSDPKDGPLQNEKTMKDKLTINVKQYARQRFLVLLHQLCLWVT
jgi:hypothetical protein